jgi:hypothetical protein
LHDFCRRKTSKTGPSRRNRHRQPWVSHERYRENGTNRWGNLTGTFRFRVRAARKTCWGAHKVTTRKTGEEERRQENQSLDSPDYPAQVTHSVVSKDLWQW